MKIIALIAVLALSACAPSTALAQSAQEPQPVNLLEQVAPPAAEKPVKKYKRMRPVVKVPQCEGRSPGQVIRISNTEQDTLIYC